MKDFIGAVFTLDWANSEEDFEADNTIKIKVKIANVFFIDNDIFVSLENVQPLVKEVNKIDFNEFKEKIHIEEISMFLDELNRYI